MENIIIIGAGASGLMAAYQLSKSGKKVTVLEARGRTGGRIHTLEDASFFNKAELGAEFVHGDLPVTLNLFKEAGITYSPAGGEMWRLKNGRLTQEDEQIEGWDKLMDELQSIKEDISINQFLSERFPDEKYDAMKKSIRQFVAGYDTADPDEASTFALREEWQNEDEGAQHRPDTGYCTMISYLVNQVKANEGKLVLNAEVTAIDWKANDVTVKTNDGETYYAHKLVIALPLGILQLPEGEKGSIKISPSIQKHQTAINQLGFGAIIKVLLRFNEAFWEHADGKDLTNMAFLFSEEKIPTWWTQAPMHQPTLTGWLGGPPARAYKDYSDDELFEMAMVSLSNIFRMSIDDLKNKLVARYIVNWTADPFTRGSYAYDTVEAYKSRAILSQPVEETIFFTGEYLYEGPSMGTVEAALTSAIGVSNKIVKVG